MDVAGHYAELQGALICYCAQPSVKSPRRPERPQIPLLHCFFQRRPSSLPYIHASIHPPVIRPCPGFHRPGPLCGGGVASGQAGWSAGRPAAEISCGLVRLCLRGCSWRARRAPSRAGEGGRADRVLLIKRSWKPAVTGHWG